MRTASIMALPLGELAALGTAVCWTASSLAFTAAGRRIGSLSLNLIRLWMALPFLVLMCWARRGVPLPTDASPRAWAWLSVSGMVGFVLGDLCLFRALLLIGPRLAMLVMALAPPITAVIGWLWLDERLAATDLAGMALTLVGIAWVVLERQRDDAGVARTPSLAGIGLAVVGAVGQAVGLVLSKIGMRDYDPFAATQIRVIAGIVGFSLIFSVLRWWGRLLESFNEPAGLGFAALGAFAGPSLGVSLSLLAIRHTQTGIAATIMALVPVLLIPAVVVLHREKVSARAVLGALVAVAGVGLLWLR
jgi:drug/metabolite transporter (DMT)-like permease